MAVVDWITAIPLTDWPQTGNASQPLRPAMPSNAEWKGFYNETQRVVDRAMGHFPAGVPLQRMLGCIMPGHEIPSHQDWQCEQWLCRVHIPLTTNPKAVMIMDDGEHHMDVGKCYRINTEAKHALRNDGNIPRIHLMFDVRMP
jgi:aspartyl/asparaginyl beta-hydroxylase (cupin superfamily)